MQFPFCFPTSNLLVSICGFSHYICAILHQSYKFTKYMLSVVTCCGSSCVFYGTYKIHSHLDSDGPQIKKILLNVNLPDQYVSTRVVDLASGLPSHEDTTIHLACERAANIIKICRCLYHLAQYKLRQWIVTWIQIHQKTHQMR